MKLILTTSPRAEGDLERKGVPFLGIGYIAGYVEKFSHHQVEIFDAHTYGYNASQAAERITIQKYREKVEELVKKLEEENESLKSQLKDKK